MATNLEVITLHVDSAGHFVIPESVRRQLAPGAVIRVENVDEESLSIRVQPPSERLIWEDGVLVFTGALPDSFDWDVYDQQFREKRVQLS
jgi:bifunctional DNA-binding transcriptional regulator/antitoxin component of YhaV-PrlF toxin-antitoxin module